MSLIGACTMRNNNGNEETICRCCRDEEMMLVLAGVLNTYIVGPPLIISMYVGDVDGCWWDCSWWRNDDVL